ncbi:MAG: energy-converting hydrogenase Eha subunit E, partial [Polaribacter sp.]
TPTPDSYRECIYFKYKALLALMLFIAICIYTSVVRVLLCPNSR